MTKNVRLTQKLRTAARRYLDLRDRRADPDGTFDTGGRWYPAESVMAVFISRALPNAGACCSAERISRGHAASGREAY